MDLKTFLKELGVNETILNNNSFETIIREAGLSNWIELREKMEDNIKEDQYKNKVVTFNTKNNFQSNLVLNVTPSGSLSTLSSVYGVNSSNQNIIVNNLNEVLTNQTEIINRNYSATNEVDLNGNVINTLGSRQTEKNYSVKTGIQTLESNVQGINIIPGVSNMSMANRPDVVINELDIVRRTEIPNVASAHCVKFDENNNKQEANGYVELDSQNLLNLKYVTREDINYRLLSFLAEKNIVVRPSLSTEEKDYIVNNVPKNIQEYIKEGLNKEIPLEYLNTITVDNELNYNQKM